MILLNYSKLTAMNITRKLETVFLLIKSLSKAEKRYFHLFSTVQSGEKAYITLFELCDDALTPDLIRVQFAETLPGKSFEMAVKHLYKVLLDCLVKLREKQDRQTEIFNRITKAGILFERELWNDAFAQLEKARNIAVESENDLMSLLILRTEVKYLSALEFPGVTERALVNKQVELNERMFHARSVNQHLQLYDILRHRIIHKGFARSDKHKDNLNDLVLSELHLIANSSYKGFEVQKLHRLFQASYYLNAGNYKAAIRNYHELIELFESNTHLLLNPPIYYFSALNGVLDSLLSEGVYFEMPYFLSKLKELEDGDYSTEFKLDVMATHYLYESSAYLQTGQLQLVSQLMERHAEPLFDKMSLIRPVLQLNIHLRSAIYYLSSGDLKMTRKSLNRIFASGKVYHSFPGYRIARLLNLLLQAELGNYEFHENEIISIKRSMSYERQIYQTEKVIFKFVKAYPLPSYGKAREKLWNQFNKELDKIKGSKYERQLLKVFNFAAWIRCKLTKTPFDEILIEETMINSSS